MHEDQFLNPNPQNAILQIETTNICNHNCVFCANSKITAPRGFIEKELAMNLIKEGYEMGVRKGAFFMFGEPLLCPDIFDYYRKAADIGYSKLILVTNLAVADEDMIKKIFDCGITDIKVSVNGGKRSYAGIHGRNDYEKVMALLTYAYQYKTDQKIPCNIISSYVVTKDNCMDIKEHESRIKNVVDFFVKTNITSFAGTMEQERQILTENLNEGDFGYLYNHTVKLPCSELTDHIVVTVDGFLSLCCHEPFGRAKIHDLHHMSLKDAWFSEKMQNIRRRHIEKAVDGLICKECLINN